MVSEKAFKRTLSLFYFTFSTNKLVIIDLFFFFLTLNREFRRMFVFIVLSETCLL